MKHERSASLILIVPKKQDCMDDNKSKGCNNGKFNLQLCTDYRKLNNHIQTACQIKANGSLGKVISNYPLLTTDNILAHFNGCKYFSTIDLRSGYYHIRLNKEAAEKIAFVTNKGQWIFHPLPFGINISPSAFSYVLAKVLEQCSEFALNYLDDIMVFSETCRSHLKHLEEVFKWLQEADLKIKCSKCEFFKSKVHYLGYLAETDGVQPLPEKVATIQALGLPKDIQELWHFLGLVGFYRKLILFFVDITACLNTILRKGAMFTWTEQYKNAFNLLKLDLIKMPRLQYPNCNILFKLFTDASKHSYLGILHQEGSIQPIKGEA